MDLILLLLIQIRLISKKFDKLYFIIALSLLYVLFIIVLWIIIYYIYIVVDNENILTIWNTVYVVILSTFLIVCAHYCRKYLWAKKSIYLYFICLFIMLCYH